MTDPIKIRQIGEFGWNLDESDGELERRVQTLWCGRFR